MTTTEENVGGNPGEAMGDRPERTSRRLPIITVLALGLLAGAAPAHAAFLDFDLLPASTIPSGVPDNAASVLTTQLFTQGIVFGQPGVSSGVAVVQVGTLDASPFNSIVGLDAFGLIPATASGDIYFRFVVPNTLLPAVTSSVSFQVGDSCCDVDSVVVRAYGIDGSLLDQRDVAGTSFQPYALAMPGIHRIEIENVSPHTSGYALDDLAFATPTAVAAPAPAMLLVAGALWPALARRRGQRASRAFEAP